MFAHYAAIFDDIGHGARFERGRRLCQLAELSPRTVSEITIERARLRGRPATLAGRNHFHLKELLMPHKGDAITRAKLKVGFGDARCLSAARQAHFTFFNQRLRFAARFRQACAKQPDIQTTAIWICLAQEELSGVLGSAEGVSDVFASLSPSWLSAPGVPFKAARAAKGLFSKLLRGRGALPAL